MGSYKNYSLVFLVILAITLLTRFYNYQAWQGFDYDQEINAWIAKTIVIDHKPVLIGPETSVGGMYVGSYFNYLIAAFFWLSHMDPAGTIWLNLLITVATVGLVYTAGAKVFSPLAGVLAAGIYTFSDFLATYDRVIWNPTPLPLVSLGTVFFIWQYLTGRRRRDLGLAAGFVGMMFHLHFSAVFLLAFFVAALVIFGGRRFWLDVKNYLVTGLGFGIFFLPLIIFDLRHQFLNSRHLLAFFFSGEAAGGSILDWPMTFFRVMTDMARFVGGVVIPWPDQLASIIGGLFLIVVAWYLAKRVKSEQGLFVILGFLLTLVVVGGLSFYHGALPSYYFFVPLSSFVVISGGIFSRTGKWLLAVAIPAAVLNLLILGGSQSGYSLVYKEQAVEYIREAALGQPVKVDIITDAGLNTGYRYLFWLNATKAIFNQTLPADKSYKMVIPYTRDKSGVEMVKFGMIGVTRND